MDTFTCASCGETFEKARTDEETLEESQEIWGEHPEEELEAICDDCFHLMMKWLTHFAPKN